MTLGGAVLTSVEKNSRPQLMSQRTSCTSYAHEITINSVSARQEIPHVSPQGLLVFTRALSEPDEFSPLSDTMFLEDQFEYYPPIYT
jgi:hypothetical protein